MSDQTRLETVLQKIDNANAADPSMTELDGRSTPSALLYGQRMSDVLSEFHPEASEHLQIAVRAQHIERWTRERGDYPEGRAGYLAWRKDAAVFHGQRASDLMLEAGYDQTDCERVALLLSKRAIKKDAEAQTLEDVACLVFMRWYFSPFAADRPEDELFRIVQKTARKMSQSGRDAALKLPLPEHLVPAIQSASA